MTLDPGRTGTTELRVHGVSGTPADAILQMPPAWVRLVAGTDRAGFHRRWVPGAEPAATEPGVDRVEAYCWGGLTSGSASRSLWLLVLPFTLADLAHWMMPLLPEDVSRRRRLAANVSLGILRVLSLSLTLTGLVAFSLVSLDLTGWQCAGNTRCVKAHGLVGWLARLDRPTERVAVMALLPALILVLVWLIGRSSVGGTSAPDPVVRKGQLPLADPTFFGVDPSVVRLRRLHVTATASLLAGLVLAPVVRYANNAAWPRFLLVVVGVLGGIAVLATCVPRIAGRGGKDATWAGLATQVLQLAAVIALLVALITPFFIAITPPTGAGHLPGLRALIIALFAIQLGLVPAFLGMVAVQHQDRGVQISAVVLLAVVAFVTVVIGLWAIHDATHHQSTVHLPRGVYTSLILVGVVYAVVILRAWRSSPRPTTVIKPTDTPGPNGPPPPAAGGLAAPLVATLAWVYSLALSAGVGLQVAQFLGHPVTTSKQANDENTAYQAALHAKDLTKVAQQSGDAPLILPPGYVWAAVGALGVAVVAACLGAYVFLRVLPNRQKAALLESRVDYPLADPAAQADPKKASPEAKVAAKARALASLTDDVDVGASIFVSLALVIGVVVLVGYLHDTTAVQHGWLSFAAAAGSWFVVAFVGGLLGLGYASLRNKNLRRTVGILWDVCTFWPRANHPFTPPPYSECAVPDLINRVTELSAGPEDRVVLSAHSQGSVLAVPVILQLDPVHVERVRLLLHGCPVSRLYARWFPAYFCWDLFEEVEGRVPGRWRTLYRRTDYIGAWAWTRDPDRAASYAAGDPRIAPDNQIDQEVPDPPLDGGPPRRHTDYWLDPVYSAAVAHLVTLTPGTVSLPQAAPEGISAS